MAHVIAELDSDGKPVRYLQDLVIKHSDSVEELRLNTDDSVAEKYGDRNSAQKRLSELNSRMNTGLKVMEI